MTSARASLFALALSALFPCVSAAQCRSADSTTAVRLAHISRMVTSTDPHWVAKREAYRLPTIADSAVAVVTDSLTCARAAAAYNDALRSAVQVAGRKVYVIRIGPCRFIVWDTPAADRFSDPYEVVTVLDERFSVLASFASAG